MHNAEVTLTNTVGSRCNSSTPIQVEFSHRQHVERVDNRKLSDIFAEKNARREFYYGIEVIARSGKEATLNYNTFTSVLPLFTSLVWLGHDYWETEPVADVESVRVAKQLGDRTLVMPHFSCYRANRVRVADMLALNFSNILVVRGDLVDDQQVFKHAADLVAEIRRVRGNTISIGIGGYPEGHPESRTAEEDVQFLVEKFNSGADFIITQICFSAKKVIEFVKTCREHDITAPILIGVYVPHNLPTLKRMMEITQACMPEAELSEYAALNEKPTEFQELAVTKATAFISEVFDSGLSGLGVQFFTMNNLQNVQSVLDKLISSKKINV